MKHLLTPGQQRITALVAEGMSNKEIADCLETTDHMIKNYLREIFDKLGLWNRVELALWWVKHDTP